MRKPCHTRTRAINFNKLFVKFVSQMYLDSINIPLHKSEFTCFSGHDTTSELDPATAALPAARATPPAAISHHETAAGATTYQ